MSINKLGFFIINKTKIYHHYAIHICLLAITVYILGIIGTMKVLGLCLLMASLAFGLVS